MEIGVEDRLNLDERNLNQLHVKRERHRWLQLEIIIWCLSKNVKSSVIYFSLLN